MPFVPRQMAYVSFIDSANRTAQFESYVSAAQARVFAEELTEAGANATAVGALLQAAAGLSGGTPREKGVKIFFFDTDAVKPGSDSEFLRGNKIVVGYRGSGRAFTRTIPARDPASYVLSPDGLVLTIPDAPAPAGVFRDAFNAVALDINGAVATLETMKVND